MVSRIKGTERRGLILLGYPWFVLGIKKPNKTQYHRLAAPNQPTHSRRQEKLRDKPAFKHRNGLERADDGSRGEKKEIETHL